MLSIKQRIKIWNQFNNPLYYWWKVRKYFKRPKFHFICGTNIYMFGFPILKKYYHKILYIRFSNVGWKSKYDEVRQEWDPYIHIRLFRKWDFVWIINWAKKKNRDSYISSMATWEAILGMIYRDKDLNTAVDSNKWSNYSSPYAYLTKLGKKEYNTMKYWICNDKDGINVYCGKTKPTYNKEENVFTSNEENYDWIEEQTLKLLHIKYPYQLKVGECIRMFIDIKSKW